MGSSLIFPSHGQEIKDNDKKGYEIAKSKWKNIKGRYVTIPGMLPKTQIFIKKGQDAEKRIQHFIKNHNDAK